MDITLKNVTKSFGTDKVLDNFNYTFSNASTTCIMGESGIGKTTLINIIAGLVEADSGMIQSDNRVSMIFQEDRLCENLTPITNVYMVLADKHYNIGNRRNMINRVAAELELLLPKDSLNKKVGLLSGGMRQRVAVVRAMMAESDVVIMDEPFKGLDTDTKLRTTDYIKSRKNGRILIVVTHEKNDINLLDADICLLTKE